MEHDQSTETADTLVVKRRHLSKVNWAHAIAKVMAASYGLKTQTALARRAGMAQSTIGRILRGEVDPQSGNLERIARAFRMTFAQLAEIAQEGVPVSELIAPDPTPAEFDHHARCRRAALISWVGADSFALVVVVGPPQSP